MKSEFIVCGIVTVVIFSALTAVVSAFHAAKSKYPTSKEITAFRDKYNCVRTGEFVGKYAVAVYNCNGSKLKEDELDAMTYREKNK